MHKFTLALAATLGLCATPVSAEELSASDANIKVAEDYLAAYSTFKVEKMEPFLADDMEFRDPTSAAPGKDGNGYNFDGKTAVMEGLGDFASRQKDFYLNYDLERRYESNGVVVFIAQLTYTVHTKTDETITGTAPIVTAVTVKDGKIVRHVDLFDYSENAKDFE